MRQYQWMFPFALAFGFLGGLGLNISILGGSILIASGVIILCFKWKLQSDVNVALGEGVKE